MFETLVTVMTAFYTVSHPSFATARFSGDNDPGLLFTILHESLMIVDGVACVTVEVYDFLGDESSPKIEVEDKDVLVVVAKRHMGGIVGSQVFEVDLGAVRSGHLFIPRCGFNVLCEQVNLDAPESDGARPTIPVMDTGLL